MSKSRRTVPTPSPSPEGEGLIGSGPRDVASHKAAKGMHPDTGPDPDPGLDQSGGQLTTAPPAPFLPSCLPVRLKPRPTRARRMMCWPHTKAGRQEEERGQREGSASQLRGYCNCHRNSHRNSTVTVTFVVIGFKLADGFLAFVELGLEGVFHDVCSCAISE
jgi:hypothetical protein